MRYGKLSRNKRGGIEIPDNSGSSLLKTFGYTKEVVQKQALNLSRSYSPKLASFLAVLDTPPLAAGQFIRFLEQF
jgi:hypothetical protein